MQVQRHNRNINPSTVIIAATLLILCSIALFSRVQRLKSSENWDVLIFTQHWPNTVCLIWEEKGLRLDNENHTCSFPQHKGVWSIHGIWPTKFGTKGPLFCNSTYHFNVTQLVPIQNNLTDYWVDIERPHTRYAFWRHEWRKHGTCAMILPQLNTEVKYFTQGLKWIQQYNMKDVLYQGGIIPSDEMGYEASVIWNAVRKVLGKNPAVECVHDMKSGQSYLFELRICFDKQLQLTDCDGIKGSDRGGFWASDVITNCPLGQPIIYPLNLPSPNRKSPQPLPDHHLVTAFKVIKFLEWLTS